MSLTSQLSGDFDGAVRQRGGDYFHSGRVQIESGSAMRVVATVRGSSRYSVKLEREGPQIVASCTCPYFDVDACKHIWAVVLAAASRGLLDGHGRSGKAYLVHAGDQYDDFDDDDDDVINEDEEEYQGISRHRQPVPTRALPPSLSPVLKSPRQPRPSGWRNRLAQLTSAATLSDSDRGDLWPSTREILYVLDVAKTHAEGELHVEICVRDRKMDGAWTKPKLRSVRRDVLYRLPDINDRRILAFLAGATPDHGNNGYDYIYGGGYDDALPSRYRVIAPQAGWILPALCQSGRCRLRLQEEDEEPQWVSVNWEEGQPWQFRLNVRRGSDAARYELVGELSRDALRTDLTSVLLAYAGVCFTRESAALYEPAGAQHWIGCLREGPVLVPAAQREEFLAELLRQPELPALTLPKELRYEEISLAPRPRLTVKPNRWRPGQLQGELSFEYGGGIVGHEERSRAVVQAAQRRVLLRDFAAECAAQERLRRLGWRQPSPDSYSQETKLELVPRHLPNVVRELTAEGWYVEADGKIYRSPGRFNIQITSGIDWFELHGSVEFGDTVARLPELLSVLRRGDNTVKLGDGTVGLLPEDWLRKYGLLAGLGTAHGEQLRFRRSQVGLLDALLAAHPQAQCDALFSHARDELRRFTGIGPADPPAGFCGELRPYQQEGLGWMHFLRHFGFGGCLADEMGLGKTVQVLALLEARRELRERAGGQIATRKSGRNTVAHPSRTGPSLVVMPKSLIFNWKQEAARFAPRLRLLDHTGTLRRKGNGHFADYDVVLTTYGTLRNDAVDFKDVRFDYLILDEAQAIKNADSASAKAARLLQGDHRLALSGTPVENHLGELWSLFEFLNPGMLGAASVFKLTRGAARNPDEETRKLLAHAVRPFLLRRTKAQVIRDLPPKVEQTLYCELESKQRRLYDELREHYRQGLLKRIEREGIQRAKIQILEALLRLRQAAIHPGLLDVERRGECSAKLDMLMPRLQEVIEEGHKTLVFSQFTGMLSILREHLDREGIAYAYLDGKTRDRQACVERFQTDPDCRLFLISLKAGGLGLNLAAAQYIFLLDPWWNPAIEAQAVDRAHRIGQTNQVFAYRLIARDTVEEKVLELQNTKRELADAIVGADNSLIRNLGKEDLELLLS
jgi:superfamily II DNA or RNA helicase